MVLLLYLCQKGFEESFGNWDPPTSERFASLGSVIEIYTYGLPSWKLQFLKL